MAIGLNCRAKYLWELLQATTLEVRTEAWGMADGMNWATGIRLAEFFERSVPAVMPERLGQCRARSLWEQAAEIDYLFSSLKCPSLG